MDHDILKTKLKLLGLDEDSTKWIESYLSNRNQIVEIESYQSDSINHPPTSVIQGSIGSCLLYSIYTIDLPLSIHPNHTHEAHEDENCPNGIITTYVDDASLVVSANHTTQVTAWAKLAIRRINDYLNANKLKLNPDKTKIVTFTKGNQPKVSLVAGGVKNAHKTTRQLYT